MPKRTTAITGAAGEHFVAYHLSAMGYPVAMTRGGSPTVDLMVGDPNGNAALSIQVKTSNWAWKSYTRNPQNSHWVWEVGAKGRKLRGEGIFYALVDLKWNPSNPCRPNVFIVPSKDVADFFGQDWPHTLHRFPIMIIDESKYRERWDLITERLSN